VKTLIAQVTAAALIVAGVTLLVETDWGRLGATCLGLGLGIGFGVVVALLHRETRNG
jgi:hypothetical protein